MLFRSLIDLLVAGRTEKIFSSAHDLSQGGLTAALTEATLRHNIGASISLDNPAIELLSETPGRVLVAVESSKVEALTSLAAKQNIPLKKLGTTGGAYLDINGAQISLDELRKAHTETFPKLFG